MGWVLMSEREVHRIEVLSCVVERSMTVAHAAAVLCLSERQVQRLLKIFRQEGAASIRHKARGRPSHNGIRESLRDYAMAIVRDRYADFGPTLAAEKLTERDGVHVSRETLRKWMVAEGLWLSRSQRRVFHRPRLRRECFGALIQIDGSDHRWFEGRYDPCTLIVAVDDATGAIQQMRFVPSESTFAYFQIHRVHDTPAGGLLFRQALGVPGGQNRCEDWPSDDAVRPRPAGAEHRDSLCKFKPSQRPGRAQEPHLAGPASERNAAGRGDRHGRRQ